MNIHWLKLDTGILDDAKIKQIRKMPDGNSIIVLWIGILCLAMKSGRPGTIEIGDGIPFDNEMLSIQFEIELNTVKLGMNIFKKFKMIEEFDNGTLYVTNFEKHQQLDKIERAKQISRQSSRKYRQKMRLIEGGDGHVTDSDDTDQIRSDKIRKDKNRSHDHNDSDFNIFWNTYDKKIDKVKCQKKFNRLSAEDKQAILDYVPLYVEATPDKQFRKHPATFLNNRSWENEIVQKKTPLKGNELAIQKYLNKLEARNGRQENS